MTWTLQISAGAGPIEVREFVAKLTQRLLEEVVGSGLQVLATVFHGDESAPRSVEISIAGEDFDVMQHRLGTHVLLARSHRRDKGARKRWFAGVQLTAALPPQSEVLLNPRDLKITTCRAGGPGGQHVNTTDSAVRVFHAPSGLSVRVATERSQHQNKRQAIARLSSVLEERKQLQLRSSHKATRQFHYSFARGSAVVEWKIAARSGTLVEQLRG